MTRTGSARYCATAVLTSKKAPVKAPFGANGGGTTLWHIWPSSSSRTGAFFLLR